MAGRASWNARLALVFRDVAGRSVLAERRHEGPLVVQKPLYPEGPGVCHAVIVHAPGGVAGGDALSIDIATRDRAWALITTPAAGKWYKADGRESRQTVRLDVGPDAIFEYLPQETIVFDAAQARLQTSVALAAGARFAAWEIVCLGRRASGESFRVGSFHQSLRILRAGRLIWSERLALEAGDRLMQAASGMDRRHVFGGMVVAAGAIPRDRLESCRALTPREGAGGITALPDIVSARYLGGSAEHARDYFESLRAALRPWYAGRDAIRPRLWAT